jgi:hypothetical protein
MYYLIGPLAIILLFVVLYFIFLALAVLIQLTIKKVHGLTGR